MKRVFWIALILLLAAGGFGYGFFHLLEQNEKLARVEWLYRYERLAWPADKRDEIIQRECEMITGTTQEQDSIKNLVRQGEHYRGWNRYFIYFNPTEK